VYSPSTHRPSGDASDVILTGSFDHWSCSIHLPKGASGFAQRISVPWNQKVPYKFIVDGRWVTRDDRPTELDGAGNLNNVLFTPSKPTTSTIDYPPIPVVPQVPTESMSSTTALPEAPSLYSETSQQEASKVNEDGGITESDSTDVTSAVVDLVVPGKELSPLNVPDVEAAEPAEPSSVADSLSAIVDSAKSSVSDVYEEIATNSAPSVSGEIASAPECISSGVSIIPSIPSDPTDNILDETEQPSAISIPEIASTVADIPDNVSSPEIAGSVPQIAPIVHIAILPVNDSTLNESASLEGEIAADHGDHLVPHPSDADTSVSELSTHSPIHLSKAASPETQETQTGEQNVLNPNPEPTQEETAEAQVVEQENGELLVDATSSDPATNGSTPNIDVDTNPVETTDTSATDAGPVMPENESSSQAPEHQDASASSMPSTPELNGDTKLKDISLMSSTTGSPVTPSSKFNMRKKRRSLFAKMKDFFTHKEKVKK